MIMRVKCAEPVAQIRSRRCRDRAGGVFSLISLLCAGVGSQAAASGIFEENEDGSANLQTSDVGSGGSPKMVTELGTPDLLSMRTLYGALEKMPAIDVEVALIGDDGAGARRRHRRRRRRKVTTIHMTPSRLANMFPAFSWACLMRGKPPYPSLYLPLRSEADLEPVLRELGQQWMGLINLKCRSPQLLESALKFVGDYAYSFTKVKRTDDGKGLVEMSERCEMPRYTVTRSSATDRPRTAGWIQAPKEDDDDDENAAVAGVEPGTAGVENGAAPDTTAEALSMPNFVLDLKNKSSDGDLDTDSDISSKNFPNSSSDGGFWLTAEAARRLVPLAVFSCLQSGKKTFTLPVPVGNPVSLIPALAELGKYWLGHVTLRVASPDLISPVTDVAAYTLRRFTVCPSETTTSLDNESNSAAGSTSSAASSCSSSNSSSSCSSCGCENPLVVEVYVAEDDETSFRVPDAQQLAALREDAETATGDDGVTTGREPFVSFKLAVKRGSSDLSSALRDLLEKLKMDCPNHVIFKYQSPELVPAIAAAVKEMCTQFTVCPATDVLPPQSA